MPTPIMAPMPRPKAIPRMAFAAAPELDSHATDGNIQNHAEVLVHGTEEDAVHEALSGDDGWHHSSER